LDGLQEALSLGLAQHPDQHSPEHPVIFAVDEEFGEVRASGEP
jgi:hypothetical protein